VPSNSPVTSRSAASTVKSRKRKLERDLDAILASVTDCPLGSELLGQIRRARDQLLTFCDFGHGKVDATNNVSERALRPSVMQRKVTNGYRAKWAADAEAAMRSTVDTAAHLSGCNPFQNHTRCHLRLIARCRGWVITLPSYTKGRLNGRPFCMCPISADEGCGHNRTAPLHPDRFCAPGWEIGFAPCRVWPDLPDFRRRHSRRTARDHDPPSHSPTQMKEDAILRGPSVLEKCRSLRS